ncbi:12552_t:CDS:2 [Acaulospora colombiana]|uniref:12552_t:CDS:1 n=1 Tax=Acaulospora colombiana TaxID=27376 RepID=A0ACA9JX81_9GLOM|nr:12552_t:CDS:2 [Acaulospora colombiana]
MTQERVNGNSSYAFVHEDPSKPRKYQLNFNLDTDYVKEPSSPPTHQITQQLPPLNHHHHQSYQPIQQHNQHNHVTQQHQHHHHNHHHPPPHQQPPPPPQQQQNLSQTHHHQQKHHMTSNRSTTSSPPSSTMPQNYQSNVYSKEIVIPERSQHDLQSASAVPPPYNAHNHPLFNRNISNHPVMHSQSNVDSRFARGDSIDSLHNLAQEQRQLNSKSPRSQSQPHKLKVQQPQPLTDLLNPPRSVSRPITPPQLHVSPHQPFLARENRETSPHLAPPPHHQSGSNSSVSTRSSSPAPSTPVANTSAVSNSNHNLPYSPHHSPNNNMLVASLIDKPSVEQNTSQVKKRGRSQKPRPIVPAGPLPSQQSSISSQILPLSSVANDSPVFVQYVVPVNGGNNVADVASQLSAPRSSHVTRKQKDNLPVQHVTPITEGRNCNDNIISNAKLSESHQSSPAFAGNLDNSLSSSFPTISTTSAVPSRKREHSAPSSPRDFSDAKRCKKEENVDKGVDVVMEDVSVTKDDYTGHASDGKSKAHMETVMILQSLKDSKNSNNPPAQVVAPDVVKVKEESVEQTSSESLKVDQVEHFVATRVRELSLDEDDQFRPLESIKKEEGVAVKPVDPVKPSLIADKSNKRGLIGGGTDNKKIDQVKRAMPVAVNDSNVGNDSDNDLAMDDGSDEEEYTKCNQSVNNLVVEDVDTQWNSDDMETEEEVEEEVVNFENTGVKDEETKPAAFVSSTCPLPSLPPSTTSHQGLVKRKNEDSRDTPSPTPAVTSTTTAAANNKHSRPASPINTNCGTVPSLVSRKGSVSSNGSNKDREALSDALEMPPAVSSPSAVTQNNNINGSGRPQRPYPPRRRSTMRDDEKLELDAIEWEKNIEIPHHIWEETLRVFEIVKHSKEMKNRQPHRKRNHILASILFILCRQNGLPRTFVEICNAASIRKQEIGSYYRLMLKVFENNGLGGGSNGTVDSAEYLKRWCQNLKLPPHILDAAIHVYKQASELNITTGKCPVSVGAASIWLSISSWNEMRSKWNTNDDHEQIKCEHKDVAQAAGVVNATLVGCFKNLSKYKEKLLPAEFLQEAKTRPPHHKKGDSPEGNANNNNTVENDCRDEKKASSLSPPHSLENLKFYEDEETSDNEKMKVEPIKIEPTTPSMSALPSKIDPATSPVSKSCPKVGSMSPSRIRRSGNNYSKSVKVESTSLPLGAVKSQKSPNSTESLVREPQEDADDELEEGELREDCDDAMIE